MRKFAGVMIALILLAPFVVLVSTRVVQGVFFDRNVAGHLKRAADANTMELAKQELSVVVQYLERTGMTSGYTSVWWNTPDEDVGFWYQNLKASLDELRSLSQAATQLEKTNVLMKLRETLLDEGKVSKVTVPDGASIFPRNTLYFWWGFASLIVGFIGVVIGFTVADSGGRSGKRFWDKE